MPSSGRSILGSGPSTGGILKSSPKRASHAQGWAGRGGGGGGNVDAVTHPLSSARQRHGRGRRPGCSMTMPVSLHSNRSSSRRFHDAGAQPRHFPSQYLGAMSGGSFLPLQSSQTLPGTFGTTMLRTFVLENRTVAGVSETRDTGQRVGQCSVAHARPTLCGSRKFRSNLRAVPGVSVRHGGRAGVGKSYRGRPQSRTLYRSPHSSHFHEVTVAWTALQYLSNFLPVAARVHG